MIPDTRTAMAPLLRLIGSLTIAVPLLITLAVVLAWGTIYEARFGTAAVQRFVYASWWFQALLAFLAINLATAAIERYPWKRRHAPFVLAHIGIILLLIGGIIGGRFGIEGQLVIPEGQAERVLQLPHKALLVEQVNPGVTRVFPTHFEARAWVHEPDVVYRAALPDGTLELVVDRYYPDAHTAEEVTGDGPEASPAAQLSVSGGDQQDNVWLFARDPQRFGFRWGEAHLVFLEPASEQELAQLLGRAPPTGRSRGVVWIQFPGQDGVAQELPVPEQLGVPTAIQGTPYAVTFKDYFPDFAITEQGLASRSDEPRNPAVSFTLAGPEGIDAHLLFAFHPEFPELHTREHRIPAQVRYTHPAGASLPPNAIALLRSPSAGTQEPPSAPAEELTMLFTGPEGQRREVGLLEVGASHVHPWLGYRVVVAAYHPRARLTQHVSNRSDEVRAEALHVVGHLNGLSADAWVGLRQAAELSLGNEVIRLAYQPAQRELPVSIKLSDFRKIDYPGTDMAAGFESDVQLTDAKRGVILMRTISMNNPLRYRGFSFYQSSYLQGPVETTVLSVRNDPGTPFVYAGFLIVIAGIVSLFALRKSSVT